VVAFGSLTQLPLFHARSDVDLAVWGLDERVYYRAVGHLQSMDAEISVDLVMIEDAKPSLKVIIYETGELL